MRISGIALGMILLCNMATAQFTTIQYLDGSPHSFRDLSHVENAGDVNGDGTDDFVVGDPRAVLSLGDTGRVRVYSGVDGSLLHALSGLTPGDRFGASVSAAGDVNGDGFGDFLVGIPLAAGPPGTSGEARVFSGADGSVLHVVTGAAMGQTGLQVTGLGDINGDGLSDFAVREQLTPTSGPVQAQVRVFSGADGSVLRTHITNPMGGGAMGSLANAGDVDGDGVNDLLVGEPDLMNNMVFPPVIAGGVLVYSGASGTLIHSILGTGTTSKMGFDVASGGDLDGDGLADLLVGAPGSYMGTVFSVVGEAWVFSGFDGSVLQSWQGGSLTVIGHNVACPGDVNGDTVPDYTVSVVPHPLVVATVPNVIRLYSGATGAALDEFPAPLDNGGFRQSAAGLGDVDGNGSADLVVGSFSGAPAVGEVRLYGSGLVPLNSYVSNSGNGAGLSLTWTPAFGNIHDAFGTLTCSGATPGALGLVLASLAPADLPIFGFDLLVAVDTTNLLLTAFLGANGAGEFVAAQVTRRNPAIAGSAVHVQFIETSPTVRASNGIRLVVIP